MKETERERERYFACGKSDTVIFKLHTHTHTHTQAKKKKSFSFLIQKSLRGVKYPLYLPVYQSFSLSSRLYLSKCLSVFRCLFEEKKNLEYCMNEILRCFLHFYFSKFSQLKAKRFSSS